VGPNFGSDDAEKRKYEYYRKFKGISSTGYEVTARLLRIVDAR
jgi:hypothetical protein